MTNQVVFGLVMRDPFRTRAYRLSEGDGWMNSPILRRKSIYTYYQWNNFMATILQNLGVVRTSG